jgi:D-alanyl-D-alanine carboxypeptidase
MMGKRLLRFALAALVSVLVILQTVSMPVCAATAGTDPIPSASTETTQTADPTPLQPPAAELTPQAIDWQDPAPLSTGAWPTLDQVAAKSYVVIDRLSGVVLLGKDENAPQYPASTTKIMTALLALENLSLDQTVTASDAAANLSWDSSKAGFLAGETATVRDVLAGLMLPSGNDAAIMLAEAIDGDVATFAERMTRRAHELGARSTTFLNAHGLHEETHVSSAADLAKIAAEAMRYPAFRELVDLPTYAMAATNKHPYHGWSIHINSNARMLLAADNNYRSTVLVQISGIKTGTTLAAGQCLVTAATTSAGQELICVLLGVSPDDLNGNVSSYSRTILEAAANRSVLSGPASATLQTLLVRGEAIETPDPDMLAIPARSLCVALDGPTEPDFEIVWSMDNGWVDGDETKLDIVRDGRILLTVPIQIIEKPDEWPLETGDSPTVGGETDSSPDENSQPSVLEWPGLKSTLLGLVVVIGLVVAYSLGRITEVRRYRRSRLRRG